MIVVSSPVSRTFLSGLCINVFCMMFILWIVGPWKDAVELLGFDKNFNLVFRRVFVTVQPELYRGLLFTRSLYISGVTCTLSL